MKKSVKALVSAMLSATLMVSSVNVNFNSKDVAVMGEDKIMAADINDKSIISTDELDKIRELASKDAVMTADAVNGYTDDEKFEIAVDAVLTDYYKSENYEAIDKFEAEVDGRANELINDYKEAAKEREAGEEVNGFKTQTIVVVFDQNTTKKEIKAIVKEQNAELVHLEKDFVGNYSAEIKISYGQTVEMAKGAFGKYSSTVCSAPNYIYEQVESNESNQAAYNEVKNDNAATEQSLDARELVNDMTRRQQWYLNLINVADAWNFIANREHEKVLVGVIDSGIDVEHEDLKNVLSPLSADVTGDEPVLLSETDSPYATTHGTMVTGFIAAQANNGVGIAGVASCYDNSVVEILGVKASYKDANGSAYFYTSNIAKGFDYCIDNGVKVINTSFGTTAKDPYYEYLARHAADRGIIIVASAGNDGGHNFMLPADSDRVISVVSTNSAGCLSTFSNYGEEKDVCAPGTSVISTYPNNNYNYGDGTSFSSPIVAGVVAMMCSVNNNLNYYDALKILVNTSSETEIKNYIGLTSSEIAKGGVVDAGKAVEVAANYTKYTSFAKDRLNQFERPSDPMEVSGKCVAPKMVELTWTVTDNVKSKNYTYNIYEGNNLIYSNIKFTRKVMNNVSVGEHIYFVKGVLNGVESVGVSSGIIDVTKEGPQSDVDEVNTISDAVNAEDMTTTDAVTEKNTETATTQTNKPLEVIGMNITLPANNTIGVVWGQDAARINSGCKYNIYINGTKVKSEVICNYYQFSNINAGMNRVKVTAVLGGVESDGIEKIVNVTGVAITERNTETTSSKNETTYIEETSTVGVTEKTSEIITEAVTEPEDVTEVEEETENETEIETEAEAETETETYANVNLAKNCYAYSSSNETNELVAANITDGDMNTRWASQWSDYQYVVVDLGKTYKVDRVKIYWEAAFATRYKIAYSTDGANFIAINSYFANSAKAEEITFLPVDARYIKVDCSVRGTTYGFSIYEMEVFESHDDVNDRNLSLGKNVTVSSIEGNDTKAEYMVDGDNSTRWASQWSDAQWVCLDLGDVYSISKVRLNWESAFGEGYNIYISKDGINWTLAMCAVSDKAELFETYIRDEARYVKVDMYRRGTAYGYSLYEFEVIGH